MSIGKDGSQRPVPTLTEVVQLPAEAAGAGRNPTNPVVTPTLRKMSIDDTKKGGNDAARNRLATVFPPPTLPPVLAPGNLPVASSPIAMPSPVFAAAVAAVAAEPVAPAASSIPLAPTLDPDEMPGVPEVETGLPNVASAVSPSAPPFEPVAGIGTDAALAELPIDETLVPPFLVAPAEAVEAPAVMQSYPSSASPEESRLVERVLADLQPHIDLLLEHRLREALAPAFERLARSLLDETREAMSHSLREVLASSVVSELERARLRNE